MGIDIDYNFVGWYSENRKEELRRKCVIGKREFEPFILLNKVLELSVKRLNVRSMINQLQMGDGRFANYITKDGALITIMENNMESNIEIASYELASIISAATRINLPVERLYEIIG